MKVLTSAAAFLAALAVAAPAAADPPIGELSCQLGTGIPVVIAVGPKPGDDAATIAEAVQLCRSLGGHPAGFKPVIP